MESVTVSAIATGCSEVPARISPELALRLAVLGGKVPSAVEVDGVLLPVVIDAALTGQQIVQTIATSDPEATFSIGTV